MLEPDASNETRPDGLGVFDATACVHPFEEWTDVMTVSPETLGHVPLARMSFARNWRAVLACAVAACSNNAAIMSRGVNFMSMVELMGGYCFGYYNMFMNWKQGVFIAKLSHAREREIQNNI